jgi:alpha-L-fucosidase
MLRQCAEGGGNFLLNIGPAPDGSVPRPCVKTLRAVGRWLDRYGASIYEATDPWEHCGLVTGGFTRKGSSVYFHCNRWPGREIAIGGMVNRVVEARIVGGRTLALAQRGSRLLLRGLPRRPPSSISTVIELRVEGTPRQVRGLGYVLPEGDPWA